MIKFRAHHPGGGPPSLGLGLSRENVNRLIDGKPIVVHGADVGIAGVNVVFIFFGETEAEMRRELIDLGAIDTDTIVHPTDA